MMMMMVMSLTAVFVGVFSFTALTNDVYLGRSAHCLVVGAPFIRTVQIIT